MNLAFYYHITVIKLDNEIMCPSYLGVFIDSLAREVDKLYILMHQSNENEQKEANYILKSKNIVWINLGLKTPVWHRALFHKRFLKRSIEKVSDAKIILVRSPSPLAPYFHKYLTGQTLFFMIVGDYLESVSQWKIKNIREYFELQYLRFNDFMFKKAIRGKHLLVNSPVLYNKYKDLGKSINLIKTTTLSNNDFFNRVDTCSGNTIELLFTGRIDPLKGLFELVEALAEINRYFKVKLNIVGWESEQGNPVARSLLNKASSLNIEQLLIFHGRKSVGIELNEMYRMADIYVLPSHEEGFPRTIWEAMANGLPVITTNVGGIPSYLTHCENVYMIKPKNADLIVDAVKNIYSDKELRQKLISNGYKIAKENTLEIQTAKIISIVKSINNE